jgi:TP901 family phage tail tape measure protein
MAQTMGQVIPTAAALKIKTEELFASVASLTSNAIPTSSAMTSLKAALSNVMKPGAQAAKMAEVLGLEFNAAALQSKGLAAFLEDVKNKTGGNQAILARLFRSTEAVNAINVLIGSGSALFEKALDDMRNSAGTTESAFSRMMDTPEKRWAKAMNTIRNAGISFGTAIRPVVEQVIAKIGVFAQSLSKVDFTQFMGAIHSIVGPVSFFGALLYGCSKRRGHFAVVYSPWVLCWERITACRCLSWER